MAAGLLPSEQTFVDRIRLRAEPFFFRCMGPLFEWLVLLPAPKPRWCAMALLLARAMRRNPRGSMAPLTLAALERHRQMAMAWLGASVALHCVAPMGLALVSTPLGARAEREHELASMARAEQCDAARDLRL